MVRIHVAAVLFLAAALTVPLAAEACSACGGAGQVPLRRDASFARARAAQEELGIWCSGCAALGLYAAEDEAPTSGPCPACSLPSPDTFPEPARAALDVHIKNWWHDHPTGRAFFLVSPIATLSTDCEELSLGKDAPAFAAQRAELAKQIPGKGIGQGKAMSAHERAHLWLARMDELYRYCNDLCGIEPAEAATFHRSSYRFNFVLFGNGGDGGVLNQRLGQLYRRGDGNLGYAEASSSVGSDDTAWARMVHNLGHIWAERLYGGETHKGVQGWLIAGMKLKTQIDFCAGASASVATETSTSGAWGGPKRLRQSVYKAVEAEKTSFPAMIVKQWEALDIQDQMIAASLIEFLSATSRPKFKALLAGLVADQKSLADALRESHGWTVGMLEASWIQFVQKTYRGDERKTLPMRGYRP